MVYLFINCCFDDLDQWYSTRGTRRLLRRYVKYLSVQFSSVYSFPMNPYKTRWKESYYKYNTHTVLSQMVHNKYTSTCTSLNLTKQFLSYINSLITNIIQSFIKKFLQRIEGI
jgi:hypothetical protein